MFTFHRWVQRDSYLPVGSQNLKAVTKVFQIIIKIEFIDFEFLNF